MQSIHVVQEVVRTVRIVFILIFTLTITISSSITISSISIISSMVSGGRSGACGQYQWLRNSTTTISTIITGMAMDMVMFLDSIWSGGLVTTSISITTTDMILGLGRCHNCTIVNNISIGVSIVDSVTSSISISVILMYLCRCRCW